MRKHIIIIITILTFSTSFAQYNWTPGKLYLKNGEVLKGYIKIPTSSIPLTPISLGRSKLKYKTKLGSKTEKFDQTQVDKVYFGTSNPNLGYYEYVPLTKNKMLLFKLIRNGKVNLYTRTIKSHVRIDISNQNGLYDTKEIKIKEYLLKRENEPIATLVLNNADLRSFKNSVKKYFSDCADIVSFIEDDIYEEYDIHQIVEDYNLICE
jgi:hypothetical protein